MSIRYFYVVPSLSEFSDVDHIEEDARTSRKNQYQELIDSFVSSGRKLVVKEFDNDFEADRFSQGIRPTSYKDGRIKVYKRGLKVYMERVR